MVGVVAFVPDDPLIFPIDSDSFNFVVSASTFDGLLDDLSDLAAECDEW